MTVRTETDRMLLRHFTADDVDAVLALHSDPAVMRYLGSPATSREEVRDATLPRFLGWHARSTWQGYFAAIGKADNEFLGWFVFRPPADGGAGGIELGYRLHTAAWGRGLATEGSLALLEDGFAVRGVPRVMATTMTVNAGSRRVMEKAGLRFVRTFHPHFDEPLPGAEHGEVEYALTRAEWAARRSSPAASPAP